MNLPTLESPRPVGYLEYERKLADVDAWQQDRVSFPHCHRCITKKVQSLAEFSAVGWDGATAKPIDPKVIAAACRFLDRLAEEYGELLIRPGTETECLVPHCVPLASGGVQLEWHVEDRILELEFESAGTIRYLKCWPGHDLTDTEDSYPADDLDRSADLIGWALKGGVFADTASPTEAVGDGRCAHLFTSLDSFRKLGVGWDGSSAPTPGEVAIGHAKALIRIGVADGLVPDRVEPSAMGGVGATFVQGARETVIEFYNSGKAHALFSDDDTDDMTTRPVRTDAVGFREFLTEVRRHLYGNQSTAPRR